jgi:hypothetical protein
MTRAVVFLAATLLAASLGVVAQENSTDKAPKQNNNSAQNSTENARSISVTGCLAAPATGGSYILTDASGMAFTLTGNTDSLQGHIGHEIQVTGQHEVGASTSTTASSSPSDAIHGKSADGGTLRVAETKVIGDHCQPVGSSQPRSGVNQNPGASTSRQAVVVADAPGNSNNNDSVEQTASDEDARNARANAQLPQTSTLLPLLGLIGLGSLVAGFFARR